MVLPGVTPRWQFAAFFASVALVVGASFAIARHRPAASRNEAALSALPGHAWLVVSIDVDALRDSALAKAFLGPGSRALPAVDTLVRPCGFDLLARVHDVLIASPEDGDKGDFGLAISGAFARDELASCAEQVIRARGGRPSTTRRGSFAVVTDESSAGGARVAFRERGLSLAGQGAWLDAMIDAADGRVARGGAEHAALRAALERALAEAKEKGSSRAIVLTALLPRAVRERLKAEGAGAAAANAFEAMLSVDQAGLAIATGPPGSITLVVAHLRCESPGECRDVQRFIEQKRFELSMDLRIRFAGFGPLFDTLTVERDGTDLSLRAQAPTDDLVRAFVTLETHRAPQRRSQSEGQAGQAEAGDAPTTQP
jgi:hypothetical protein